MSDVDLKLTPAQAVMFCQSYDMELASLQSQEEYLNLQELLRITLNEYDSLLIEAYRSEIDEKVWISGGNPVNYTISFIESEYEDEFDGNCLAFYDNSIFVTDVSCETQSQFICEKNKFSDVKEVKEKDLNRIVDHFASFFHATIQRTISKSLFLSRGTATWIDAQTICKSNGWNLFFADSQIELDMIKNKFIASEEIPEEFHVGLTEMGTGQNWYSIGTGNQIDYDLNLIQNYYTDASEYCGKMKKIDGKYRYEKTSCNQEKLRFICEKNRGNFDEINKKKNSGDALKAVYYSIWFYYYDKSKFILLF